MTTPPPSHRKVSCLWKVSCQSLKPKHQIRNILLMQNIIQNNVRSLSLPEQCRQAAFCLFKQRPANYLKWSKSLASAAQNDTETPFFWVITQRIVIISYRRFGTTCWSRRMGSIVVPKRRQEITHTRCVITQKNGVLRYFAAQARNLV